MDGARSSRAIGIALIVALFFVASPASSGRVGFRLVDWLRAANGCGSSSVASAPQLQFGAKQDGCDVGYHFWRLTLTKGERLTVAWTSRDFFMDGPLIYPPDVSDDNFDLAPGWGKVGPLYDGVLASHEPVPPQGEKVTFVAPVSGPVIFVLWSSGAVDVNFSITVTAQPAPNHSVLLRGHILNTGQSLISTNRKFKLVMQADGNLVEYMGRNAVWSTGTRNERGPNGKTYHNELWMKADGNLTVYNAPTGTTEWQTSTTKQCAGDQLVLQDDGNLVIYGGGKAMWSRETGLICYGGGSTQVADKFASPIPGYHVQQGFEIYGRIYAGAYHTGVDLQYGCKGLCSIGKLVYATANGVVVHARHHNYPGNVVILKHMLPDGNVVYSMYGHLGKMSVHEGDVVSIGQEIGTILSWPGNRSNSHLHFEIRTFFQEAPVNAKPGCAPRHCNPAGPGYWPDPARKKQAGMNPADKPDKHVGSIPSPSSRPTADIERHSRGGCGVSLLALVSEAQRGAARRYPRAVDAPPRPRA